MPGSRPHPSFLFPFLLLFCVVAPWGCSRDSQTSSSPGSGGAASSTSSGAVPTDHAPIIRSARIFPVDVTLDTTLQVDVQAEDLGGGRITYRYQWYVNDVQIPGATQPQFVVEQLKKGDRVKVDVTPNDGQLDGAVYKTTQVTVGNTAPEIGDIFVEPIPLRRGDVIKVKVNAADAEGDPITLIYKWLRNDKEIPDAKSETLETKDFAKKDVIRVLVSASDGKATREPKAGPALIIENSPPRFTSTPPTGLTLTPVKDGPAREGVYEYAVVVVDPDGDPVTLELKQGPPGMALDAATGKLTWKVTVENLGKYHVVIAATDNDKGVTQQEFDLDLQNTPAAAQGS